MPGWCCFLRVTPAVGVIHDHKYVTPSRHMATDALCLCLQVPPHEGINHLAEDPFRAIPYNWEHQRTLPNEDQLWHLIFLLDRAAVMGFWFLYDAQYSSAKAKLKENSRHSSSLIGPNVNPHVLKHFEGDFHPSLHDSEGERAWGRSSGLINLHDVYPGVQDILVYCLAWSKLTRVWLCSNGHWYSWSCFPLPAALASVHLVCTSCHSRGHS